jgi:hypothetical protein
MTFPELALNEITEIQLVQSRRHRGNCENAYLHTPLPASAIGKENAFDSVREIECNLKH